MRITKVSASYGRTTNTGNYESLRAEATIEADVDEGEDVAEALAIVQALAKGAVKDQVWRDRDTYHDDWPR